MEEDEHVVVKIKKVEISLDIELITLLKSVEINMYQSNYIFYGIVLSS